MNHKFLYFHQATRHAACQFECPQNRHDVQLQDKHTLVRMPCLIVLFFIPPWPDRESNAGACSILPDLAL